MKKKPCRRIPKNRAISKSRWLQFPARRLLTISATPGIVGINFRVREPISFNLSDRSGDDKRFSLSQGFCKRIYRPFNNLMSSFSKGAAGVQRIGEEGYLLQFAVVIVNPISIGDDFHGHRGSYSIP